MQGCAKFGDVVEVEDVVEDKEVVEIGEDARFCTSCRSEKYPRFPDESAVDVSTSCAFYQTSIML